MSNDTAPKTQSSLTITLTELGAVVQLIDLCSKRGAFAGNELASVGTLRNKIDQFVKAHTPLEKLENNEQHPHQSG